VAGTSVSSTNKTNHHVIAEILLTMLLNTITLNLIHKRQRNPKGKSKVENPSTLTTLGYLMRI
jgi:hypothetical protein